jgi:serine protease AprX
MTNRFNPLTQARTVLVTALAVLALLAASVPTPRGLSAPAPVRRPHLSADLLALEARHSSTRERVIVQGSKEQIDALAARHHLPVVRYLLDAAVILADSAELSAVAAEDGVGNLSGDLPVSTGMSVSDVSTAANQVRAGASGFLGIGAVPPVTGHGVTVAVIDSGISYHKALGNKVIANISFVTGDPSVADAFGHGTHVAGIIAGSASAATGVTSLYTGGIAPDVQLINVRVLGSNGMGLTSDVLQGIQWVIAHRDTYKIKIINLSLGHPVTEFSATDPLDQAVMQAVLSGIVVVASAGNGGRSPTGGPVLGSITSPGNSPYAITVGALNTWGTAGRSDDTIASYSSRGPTQFDEIVKPDLAAPGNKIISLEAKDDVLSGQYPFLHTAGGSTNSYMQLSGTSMAAPMVSGAAALLLQGTPGLSPAQMKFALQSGATYMPDAGLLGAGAGSANFWSSRKTAQSGPLLSLPAALIGGLLARPSGAVFWDAGTLTRRLYAHTGIRLLSLVDLVLAWLNPSSFLKFGDLNLVGLTNTLASLTPKQLLWGEVGGWTSGEQIIWGETIYNPQGEQIIWGEQTTTEDNQIIWGESALSPADPQ